MKNKGLDNYRKAMQSYEEQPSDRAWDRLDNKIQLRSNKNNAQRYKWVAIVASLIAVVSIITIYQHDRHVHNPELFAYKANKSDQKPLIIEGLDTEVDEGIYATERLEGLTQAYQEGGLSEFMIF